MASHNSSHTLEGEEFLVNNKREVRRYCKDCRMSVRIRTATEADKKNLPAR